jgi:hypothetical protein
MLVDDPALQRNPGQGESGLVATGLLLMASILSEIESEAVDGKIANRKPSAKSYSDDEGRGN